MKKRKRAIGLVLAVMMILSLAVMENHPNTSWFCEVAFADTATIRSEDNKYDYTILDDDTVKIERYLNSEEMVTVPATLGGKSVTCIGDRAFTGVMALKSITLPNSIKSIGNNAFNGCANLENVTIPGSVGDIGEFAFVNCTGLTSVTIQNGVESIKHDAFNNCASLAAITIPDSVTEIGEWAFYKCASLEAVTIPSSVSRIDLCAFSDCSSLVDITISDGATGIGEAVFNNCTSLESIIIPGSVENIANGTFYNCSRLNNITIGDGVESIGDSAFQGCTGLESITIPNGVESIGDSIFYGCTSLESVIMPDSMSEIKAWAFSGCTSLTSMIIPSGVGIIQGTFYGCTSLGSITIPDSVTVIGEQTFYSCTSLTSITIPDSVTSIGNDAFPNLPSLKIYCNTGTAAETYAISNNLNYELIKNISTLTAELSANSFEYDGTAKSPEVIVKDGTVNLVKDTDYTVAYVSNAAVGTATVIITGKGKYVGEKLVTFEIKVSSGGSTGGSKSHGGGSAAATSTEKTNTSSLPTQAEATVTSTVTNGTANVTVEKSTVADAIKKAQEDAKKSGSEKNGIAVEIKVDTKNSNASNLSATLPKASMEELVKEQVTALSINASSLKMNLNLETLKAIQEQAGSDVNASVKKVDNNTLSAEARAVVGDRPVFDFAITGANGTKVTNFGKGEISVSIPYTLGANEKAENVAAYYIDDEGKVQEMPNCVYDEKTKTLSFVTNHFSVYAVGYKAEETTAVTETSFTDIANHWAKEEIQFATAKGLFSGTGNGKFSPNLSMTRGMFVTVLGRLANADVSSYTGSSFADVKANAYYTPYIQWAGEKGIANGVSETSFAPDQSITREQMAVIMAGYAKATGLTLPQVNKESTFADNGQISSYAKETVKQMQMAGVLAGKDGNKFDSKGKATRAEVSVVIKRFAELTETN